MAHFAKINSEKKVLTVLTFNDADMIDGKGQVDEATGQQYLEKHNNWPANQWIQTSYNTRNNTHILGGTPFRGNYAGIGYEWDEANQIFWPKKPHASWVKNMSEARWQSPIGDAPAMTEAEKETHSHYVWNEEAGAWALNT
tara:strand:+ start:1439 stop:1861 length:423 start_codon:yes stop_codon:yes gene_type:complete